MKIFWPAIVAIKCALFATIIVWLMLSPSPAATIIVDENPTVLSVEYPELYGGLVFAGVYGPIYEGIPTCIPPPEGQCTFSSHRYLFATVAFEDSFPVGTQFVFTDSRYVTMVPEPATWSLMLFGFAFFAIKGIWPAWKRE